MKLQISNLCKARVSDRDEFIEQDGFHTWKFDAPIQDLSIIDGSMYLLFKKELKIQPIHECGNAKTCEDCLDSKFPSCGWCPILNKCSNRAECSKVDSKAWISKSAGICPSLEPRAKFFSRGKKFIDFEISIDLDRDPTKNKNRWKCQFSAINEPPVTTPAELKDESHIICNAPWTEESSKTFQISSPNEDLLLDVVVNYENDSGNQVPIAASSISVFDCSVWGISGFRTLRKNNFPTKSKIIKFQKLKKVKISNFLTLISRKVFDRF